MTQDSALIRTGRVWKFDDNINTDLIFPNAAFRMPEAEQYRLVFSANRPGWVDLVKPGDLLIAGRNFGMGSGRPIGRLLKECGIAGLAVDSINGLGLRNCVNYGMPALQCQGVLDLFEEGQSAQIDYSSGMITNQTTGATLQATPMPELLQGLVRSGGVVPMLIAEGFIEETPTHASTR